MRISQVISGIHRSDAGPSYSVTRLSEELSIHNEVTLHTLEPAPDRSPAVDAVFYPRLPLLQSLGISPAMKRGLRAAARESDIMHSHGLWMMPNVYPGAAVEGTDCSLVVSPRGMLSEEPLRISRRRKAAFSALVQKRSIDRVDLFHATSMLEANAIREAGYRSPIVVAPIGIDIPEPRALAQERRGTNVVYLGRIHPIKGIELLIDSWTAVHAKYPDWDLQIAGPGRREYVAALMDRAGSADHSRIHFVGPIYGDEKSALLANADLFVLPSKSESFGVALTEALSYGVPVLTTTGVPWPDLEARGCGWWVEPTIASFSAALEHALSVSDSDRTLMGSRGAQWMSEDFSWKQVGAGISAAYHWLRSGHLKPDHVFVD